MPKYYDESNIHLNIDFENNFQEKLNRWEGRAVASF
jgi:hypothetical protein